MNNRLFIIAGIGTGVVCFWFFFGFAPMKLESSQLQIRIEQAHAQLIDFQTTMDELPNYLKTSRDLEEFRSRLNSSLYAKTDILALLDRLRKEAKSKGLTITEITPPVSELLALNRATLTNNQPQFLNLSLKIKGEFVQFGKYVELLEEASYFRGVNFCFVNGSTDPTVGVTYTIGFRALLTSKEASG